MAGTIQAPLDLDDLDSVHDFLMRAAVVESPPLLHAIVALHWRELLHKVKPPLRRCTDHSVVRLLKGGQFLHRRDCFD